MDNVPLPAASESKPTTMYIHLTNVEIQTNELLMAVLLYHQLSATLITKGRVICSWLVCQYQNQI